MIDTHAHLDHVKDLPGVLTSAGEAGVSAIVAVGEDLESNRKILDISRSVSHPRVYPGFGFHPDRVHRQDCESCLAFIKTHSREAVAVGEIGLDFSYPWVRGNASLKEKQREVFRLFLRAASDADLPAVIHSRGAWQDCVDITLEEGTRKAVFHWYSGPLNVLETILSRGYYVSCSPSLAYSKPAQAVVLATPWDRLLVETDTPVFYRNPDGPGGFTATPGDVRKTLTEVCRIKKYSEDAAAEVLNRNARLCFALM